MSLASNLGRKIIPPWRYDGKPAAGIAIKLAAGANALDTSRAVKEELNRLSAYFPASLEDGLSLRHHAVYRNFYSGSFENTG